MSGKRQNYTHIRGDDDPQHLERNDISQKQEISIDDAVETVGFGRFQARILVAAGLCFAADAMQVILLTFLTQVLQEEWGLSEGLTVSITSFLFAGSMLGTLVLGPLADSIGRRPVFLLSGIVISVFGFGVAASSGYWILTAMIFMVGFGVGGLTVPFDILAEFLPSERRGTYLLLIEYFWTLGVLFVVVAAWLTLSTEQMHWRLFVAICSVPCLFSVMVAYIYVPESPRWLCAEGRTEEAMHIMQQVAKINGFDPTTVFPEGLKLRVEEAEKETSLADLFSPKWRWIILRLWGAWIGFAFGYYGVLEVMTRVFQEDRTSTTENSSETPHHEFDYMAIFVSSAAEFVGTTLVIVAVDRAGRISSQVIAYTCAGISVCLLCVLAAHGSPRYQLVILAFIVRVFEMAGTCVTWVSTAEILTTEVRSTGHSTANALARLGALFTPFVVQGSIPLAHIGLIMLISHLFTVLCVSKLPETKGRGMGSSSIQSGVPYLNQQHDGVFTIDSGDEGSSSDASNGSVSLT